MATYSEFALLVTLAAIAPSVTGFTVDEPNRAPVWEFGLGTSAISLEHYPGSDQRYQFIAPFPFFVYRGRYLQVDREAVKGKIVDGDRLSLDVSISGSLPVISKRTAARKGMPDIPPILSVGPRVKLRLLGSLAVGEVSLELPLEAAISAQVLILAYSGLNSVTQLKYQQIIFDSFDNYWGVQATCGLLLGDKRYHDYFYGVSRNYMTLDRPIYESKTGYGGWRISMGASTRFGRWWWGTFARYLNLSHASYADSPLVRQTSAFTVGAALAWIFKTSHEPIEWGSWGF